MVHFTFPMFTLLAIAVSVSASEQQQYLDAHNMERTAHGAEALVWDDELASSAQSWANQCKFEHNSFGQNLAAGGGSFSIETAVGMWNAERSNYDPSNPQYSHWTQVVWKSTTSLGCYMETCAPGTIFDESQGPVSYVVCDYSPPGNVIGQFDENVQL